MKLPIWKEFLYFSKKERRGIYVLAGIVVLSFAIMEIIPYYKTADPLPTKIDKKEFDAFLSSVYKQKKQWSYTDYFIEKHPKAILAPFDPNTADSITFIRMGLPWFVAKNIIHYRAKGGIFHKPEDFAHVYGLYPEEYDMLKPYIVIGAYYLKKPKDSLRFTKSLRDTLKYYKYPIGTVISLSTADTTELKKIPGIGIGTAKRIIAYRKQVGGFYKVEQLQEISHLTSDLNKWFRITTQTEHNINLNKWGLEHLAGHPYINFYQAKVIVEYRKKRGALHSLSQLKLYEEFTPADFERLSHYVCF
jgi:competence ComEA-like helix-hairpin-helix protein